MTPPDEFFIMKGGKVTGPYTAEELVVWIEEGRAGPVMQICPSGTDDWAALAEHLPGPVAEASERLLARHVKARKVMTVSLVISLCAIFVMLAWGLFVTSIAGKAEERLAATAADTQERERQLTEANAKLRTIKSQTISVEDQARKSAADAREAREQTGTIEQRLAEKERALATKSAEVASSAKRVREMEKLALSYADKLVGVTARLQQIASIPTNVKVLVQVEPGALSLNEFGIKAAIRNAFTRAGYKLVPEDSYAGDYVLAYAEVRQIEITEDINSAYSVMMKCLTGSVRGDTYAAYHAFDSQTVGYTGHRAGYNETIEDYFRDASTKAIARLRELSDEAKRAAVKNPPFMIYGDLTAAGVDLDVPKEPKDISATASGSGVVIASRPLILTNHHVVGKSKRMTVFLDGQTSGKEAVLLCSDSDRDLAVLALKDRALKYQQPPFPLLAEEAELTTGSEVFSLGYPLADLLGDEVKYSAGAVSSLTGLKGDARRFQLSVPTQPGNSGGPVFLKSGELCGVMVSTLNPFKLIQEAALPQNVNYAIKTETVRAFLKENGLWGELEADKRERLNVEQAKRFAVRIEVYQ